MRCSSNSVSNHCHYSSLLVAAARWAGCGLLSLSLFGIVLLGKTITVILGAVWILSQDGKLCVSAGQSFAARESGVAWVAEVLRVPLSEVSKLIVPLVVFDFFRFVLLCSVLWFANSTITPTRFSFL